MARLSPAARRVLVSTLAANALLFFDQTAVTVALPSIRDDFGSSAVELHWVITSYLLALAVFMAVAGRLADQFGLKRLYLAGVTLFGAASAVCAVTPNLAALVAARFVQGIGGALVQPLALDVTTSAVDEQRRGWAIGALSTGGTTFLALGPILAGALLEFVSWRWLFLINLPIVLLSLIEGARWIAPSVVARVAGRFDVWGVVLLLVGLGAAVLGIVEIDRWGAPAFALVAVGAAVLAGFVVHELRTESPLMRFDFLRIPILTASLVALFATQFVVLGTTVYLVLFLQNGLGETAMTAGLVLAFSGLFTPLLSTTTGRMTDRYGPRRLVLPGLALLTIGALLTGVASKWEVAALLVPGLLVYSLGRPAVFTPASVGPLSAMATDERGFASSLVTESRQLGSVLGVAVMGAVYTAVGASQVDVGRIADGFRAAMITGAAVAAAAAVFVSVVMPRGKYRADADTRV